MVWSLKSTKLGQSLVEIIIAIGLSAIILPAVYLGFIAVREGKAIQVQRAVASDLMRELVESTRQVREYGWIHFASDGVFHPEIVSNAWTLVSGELSLDGYTRSITISPVHRDNTTGLIADPGPNTHLDLSTKLVTFAVSWDTPVPKSVSSTAYFTRYLENDAYIETTYDQFNAGIQTGVSINYTGGSPTDGDIRLGGGGHGDWCKPSLSIYGFNLNHNAQGRAVSAIEGRAYAVTGDNNASETFYDVIISNTNPPTATSAGFLTGQKKAYGVFGDQNYGYIATDTKQKQGTIINLNNYSEVGYLDLLLENIRGRSITVSNNLAYLSGSNVPGTDNRIYIYDISTITGTHAPIAISPQLGGTSNKISVVGNNLYAAVNSASNQLVILPLTDGGRSFGTPVNITVNGAGGRDVYVRDDGTRSFLATAADSGKPEMFIIDTDPLSGTYRQVLGSYDTSGMDPQGITVVTNNKVIIAGTGGVEYQVVDISNEASISNCSGVMGDFNFSIWGIASIVEADGDAYSYIITSDSQYEFKIIEGGPSGQVGTSGAFESAPLYRELPTAFNRLTATVSTPPGTSVQFQAAVADAVSGGCSGVAFTFQPLDATGIIPLDNDDSDYENPGQCFSYKALLNSTSAGSTPVVNDVTVNYSP